MRADVRGFSLAGLFALALSASVACGETRRPIGEECIRDDDCLSGVCSARSCVSAPSLVTGANGPPPDEEPLIPEGEAGAPADAGGAQDGG